jgi:hypothetical protein
MDTLGAGIIVLAVFWLISIAFLLFFCSVQGKAKFVSIVPSIFAAILTIILVSLPRGVQEYTEEEPEYNFSFIPLIWILLFTWIVITLVISLMMYLVTDIMEPRYAAVSKTPGYMRNAK